MLEIRFGSLCVSDKYYITELYPQLYLLLFFLNNPVPKTNQSIKVVMTSQCLLMRINSRKSLGDLSMETCPS